MQLVSKYGLSNCSEAVKLAYDTGKYNQRYPVVYFLMKNPGTSEDKGGGQTKPFISYHYEPGNKNPDQFLKVSGFHEFPVYCPRWEVTGEDDYGTDCPGMTTLGDIKALQLMERRKAQAIDKMVNPPLQGPASLKNSSVSALPVGLTLFDAEGKDGLRPIYQSQPNVHSFADMKL